MIYNVGAMCFLSVSLTAFSQPGNSMKQAQFQLDQMRHGDSVKHDGR